MAPCYVCGAAGRCMGVYEHSVTSESKVIPGRSSLHLCGRCGHVYTLAKLDVAAYYAEQYDATLTDDGMDEIVTAADGRIVFRTDLDYDLMKQYVEPIADSSATLFEYGAGRGRILSRLWKDGYRRLHAYEVSELYREALSSFAAEGGVYIGARPTGRRFDVACSLFVLEHDAAPLDSLLYLKSVLRDGGHLYLMLPNYRTNIVDLACADHLNHFSSDYLDALVRACGFDVLVRDDRSNVGSTVILARSDGRQLGRGDVALENPAMVEQSAAAVNPFIEYIERVKQLPARLNSGRRTFLYGAGFYATLVAAYLGPAGIEIAGIFDANPRKHGTMRLGARVASPELIASGAYRDATLVICVNPAIGEMIRGKHAEFFHGALVI